MSTLDIMDKYLPTSFIGDSESIHEEIRKISLEKAFELNAALAKSLPAPRDAVDGFNYIADSTFSGLPFPCAGDRCRLSRVSELIGFSSIYANQVIVYNPFSFASSFHANPARFYKELSFGIVATLAMQSLIDRGILTFVNFNRVVLCKECLSKLVNTHLQGDIASRFDFFSSTYNALLETTKVELVEINSSNKKYRYRKTEICELAHDHPSYWVTSRIPKNCLFRQLPYTLTREEVIEIGAHYQESQFAANDLLMKSQGSYSYRVNMIHSSLSELAVLQRIFGTSQMRNKFDASLPFVSTRNAKCVLTLRDQEWHHFEEFRTVVFDTISKNEIEGRELDDLYRGEILPQMVKLEKIVREFQQKNRDMLIDNSAVSALSLLSVAMTGGVTSVVGLASALLGGGHFAKSMVPTLRKALSEPDSVRDSTFYYAWRVKKL